MLILTGSGRPRSACNDANIAFVEQLASSQDNQRGHCSLRTMSKHLGFAAGERDEEQRDEEQCDEEQCDEEQRDEDQCDEDDDEHVAGGVQAASKSHLTTHDGTSCRAGKIVQMIHLIVFRASLRYRRITGHRVHPNARSWIFMPMAQWKP